jgi:hypothetical protein
MHWHVQLIVSVSRNSNRTTDSPVEVNFPIKIIGLQRSADSLGAA